MHKDYSKYLGFLMGVAFRGLKKKADQALAPFHLTAQQWGVLARLYEEDGLAVGEIANRMQTEVPTVTRIVDLLEGKGFVSKKPSMKDRRSVQVFLTQKGMAIEAALRDKITKVIEIALKGFETHEVDRLKRDLSRITKNLMADKPEKQDGVSLD
ncbi:MAG: MarR family transcriptional regulator [Desulfoferrobacter sp.]